MESIQVESAATAIKIQVNKKINGPPGRLEVIVLGINCVSEHAQQTLEETQRSLITADYASSVL